MAGFSGANHEDVSCFAAKPPLWAAALSVIFRTARVRGEKGGRKRKRKSGGEKKSKRREEEECNKMKPAGTKARKSG